MLESLQVCDEPGKGKDGMIRGYASGLIAEAVCPIFRAEVGMVSGGGG